MKSKGDNPGEVTAVSAASAAFHPVGPILENRASTLLRLKKVNSGAHLEVSVIHAGYLNLYTLLPMVPIGSVEECLTRNRGGGRFEPHRRHCFVVLEQDTFILA